MVDIIEKMIAVRHHGHGILLELLHLCPTNIDHFKGWVPHPFNKVLALDFTTQSNSLIQNSEPASLLQFAAPVTIKDRILHELTMDTLEADQ
jgi:hypothetical protein